MERKSSTIEELLEVMKSQDPSAEQSYSFVVAIEEKFKGDIDLLFERLAGGHIHEIQSKIGYAKNLLDLVVESKGAFEYKKALQSAINQMEDILALYQKAGISTQLKV